MFKKLLIKLGLMEDPKKAIEKILSQLKDESDYVKVLPKKKPVKKAPAKKKAAKKAK